MKLKIIFTSSICLLALTILLGEFGISKAFLCLSRNKSKPKLVVIENNAPVLKPSTEKPLVIREKETVLTPATYGKTSETLRSTQQDLTYKVVKSSKQQQTVTPSKYNLSRQLVASPVSYLPDGAATNSPNNHLPKRDLTRSSVHFASE